MKTKIIALVSILFFHFGFTQKAEVKPYIDFLKNQKFPTAKDYILKKFEKKDIVIISERDHRDLSQYDIIFDVLKDRNFKGNIYTEVGTSNNQQRINKFLTNSALDEKAKNEELLAIYRDLDYEVVWEKYNFFALLETIYEINKTREKKDKILLFPLDVAFDWNEVKCNSHYKMFVDYLEDITVNRNIIMGKNFIQFYEAAKKYNPERPKALVIENTYHGYIRIPKPLSHPTEPDIYSTGEYIYKTYPETTTNIYVNYYTQGFYKGLTNNGLFDAAFAYTKIDNVGFDLKNTPFGNSKFDLYNFGGNGYEEVNFDYIFDGMIFYKPVSQMNLVIGIPNIYPKKYEKQFFERCALTDGTSYEESVKNNQDFLKEVNTKKESKLPEVELQKIKEQINYWLK